MPTATDLVTDLPADFATFGQAVATSMADLLGGTTGQILSKASNTDMDFTWVTNDVGDITAVTAGTGISGGGTSGAVTITNSMATEIAAKGDLIAGTGSQTFDNVTVGTNGQVLTADSTASTGLAWATPSSGTLVLLNTTTFSSVSSQSVDNVFSSTYDNYVLYFYETGASANHNLRLDMRVSSTDTGMTSQMIAQYAGTITGSDNGSGSATRGLLCTVASAYTGYTAGKVDIMNPNLAQRTTAFGNCFAVNSSGQPYQYRSAIYTDGTTQFTGFTLNASSGTISGSLKVYGVKN